MSGAVIIPLPLYLHSVHCVQGTPLPLPICDIFNTSSTVYLCPWLHCFLMHSGVPLCVPSTRSSKLRILDHIRLTHKVTANFRPYPANPQSGCLSCDILCSKRSCSTLFCDLIGLWLPHLSRMLHKAHHFLRNEITFG